MYELPPILQGTERQQLTALRDYLVRLAQSLEPLRAAAAGDAAESAAAIGTKSAAALAVRGETAATLAREAQLRALIVKTADTVQHSVDRLSATLREDYLAASDFGSFQERLEARIEATARGVVESYGYDAALTALDGRLETAGRYVNTLRGELRRGLISDPETGETALGIAIAEELRFTGEERTENGLVYHTLEPGQTLGLYTATGWQFWINGSKRGWFNSVDGMLHVTNLAVEQSLRLGAGWEVTVTGGFGVRYVG